jgi:hypothetical protein
LDENPFDLESVMLDFIDTSHATFQVSFKDGSQSPSAMVGLDGVYRLTVGMDLDRAFHRFADFQELSVGLRGHWSAPQTFLLEYDTIVNYYFYLLQLRFEGDHLTISASERTGTSSAVFEGRMQNP